MNSVHRSFPHLAALLMLTVHLASCSGESGDATSDETAPPQTPGESPADSGPARPATDEPGAAIAAARQSLPDGAGIVYVTN